MATNYLQFRKTKHQNQSSTNKSKNVNDILRGQIIDLMLQQLPCFENQSSQESTEGQMMIPEPSESINEFGPDPQFCISQYCGQFQGVHDLKQEKQYPMGKVKDLTSRTLQIITEDDKQQDNPQFFSFLKYQEENSLDQINQQQKLKLCLLYKVFNLSAIVLKGRIRTSINKKISQKLSQIGDIIAQEFQ